MQTIIFIHGMFQTPKSWNQWKSFFEQQGYRCLVPAWPLHEGDPINLRAIVPEGTGELVLSDLISSIERVVDQQPEPPILIGHSLGGLITQVLINRGLAAAGVCISTVAPNAMLSFEWDFLKNSVPILNPLQGDAPQEMTAERFHEVFANTLTESQNQVAWHDTAVHESRNVLRTALGEAGHVDLEKPHVPLLFLCGSEDKIIPTSLVKKNYEAYADEAGPKELKEFQGRSHFICGEPGWEDIATYVEQWLRSNVPANAGEPLLAS